MKAITIFTCAILLSIQVVFCQVTDTSVVNYFKKKKYINVEYFLFAPHELIKVVEDSLGKKSFKKNIDRYAPSSSSHSDVSKEKRILITSIYDQVKTTSVKTESQRRSKAFIMETLKPSLVHFDVDEKLLLSRFRWSEERAETCDIENSLYIFIVYNPVLYIKACKMDKDLSAQTAPFPFSCTLENINIPMSLRKKMKAGLIEQLKDCKEPELVNIRNSIMKFEFNEDE